MTRLAPIRDRSLRRLPLYLSQLRRWRDRGVTRFSCTDLADTLGFDPSTIRKDMAATGVTGRPRAGYALDAVERHLAGYLGWDNPDEAFLVGAGPLGRALAGWEGFAAAGLRIVGVFDPAPEPGAACADLPVLPLADLPGLARRMHVGIAVMTLPGFAAAQAMAILATGGITAVWNLGGARLAGAPGIDSEDLDLRPSLAALLARRARPQPDAASRPDRTPGLGRR